MTYDRSSGVAGCDPPIVCAKLVAAVPVDLACWFGRPGAPFATPPNAQLAPLPFDSQCERMVPDQLFGSEANVPSLPFCNRVEPNGGFRFCGACWPVNPEKARRGCGVGPAHSRHVSEWCSWLDNPFLWVVGFADNVRFNHRWSWGNPRGIFPRKDGEGLPDKDFGLSGVGFLKVPGPRMETYARGDDAFFASPRGSPIDFEETMKECKRKMKYDNRFQD